MRDGKFTKKMRSCRRPSMSWMKTWHMENNEKTSSCFSSTSLNRWAIPSQRCLNEKLKTYQQADFRKTLTMSTRWCMPSSGKSAKRLKRRRSLFSKMDSASTETRSLSSRCPSQTGLSLMTVKVFSSKDTAREYPWAKLICSKTMMMSS